VVFEKPDVVTLAK